MNNEKVKHPPFHYWQIRLFVGMTMVILAFLGMIITEIEQNGGWHYWRILCFLFAISSVGLNFFLRKKEQTHFLASISQELLHWIGLFLLVLIVTVMENIGLISRYLSSIVVLLLLSFSTYISGVYTEISMVFVGILLGLFALGLSIVSAYLYPIIIPLAIIALSALWIYLKRKHHHFTVTKKEEL